jgi:tetratricopeptide (TPR) repeat protein
MAYMTPFTHWRERDQLLLKSAEVQPNNLTLHIFSTWSLRNAGRTSEALAQAKLAVDTSPWDAASRWNLALALLQDGRAQDAANVVAEARRLHPRNVWLAFGDLFVAELSAPPSPRMFAIMDDPVWNGVPEAGIFPLLRGGYTTARSGDAATKRATADIVRDVGLRHPVAPSDVIGLLSALGDIDGAFLVADRFAAPANVEKPMAFQPFDTDSLFAPSGAALRRDPRFMRLAARLGLVDYWRSTGHWPDFCNNDQLPYDCQVEAARLARR